MSFAERIALTIASWKFSPGPISRHEIQQVKPRDCNASQIVSATFRSLEE
jgi:hypothetical protein